MVCMHNFLHTFIVRNVCLCTYTQLVSSSAGSRRSVHIENMRHLMSLVCPGELKPSNYLLNLLA